MRKYTSPEMNVCLFENECIATEASVTPLPTIDPMSVPQSEPVSIDGVETAVKGNVNFQKAIEFK